MFFSNTETELCLYQEHKSHLMGLRIQLFVAANAGF